MSEHPDIFSMHLGQLYREALRYGSAKVHHHSDMRNPFCASIKLQVGGSALETTSWAKSPEQAFRACIIEARGWPIEPLAPEALQIEAG